MCTNSKKVNATVLMIYIYQSKSRSIPVYVQIPLVFLHCPVRHQASVQTQKGVAITIYIYIYIYEVTLPKPGSLCVLLTTACHLMAQLQFIAHTHCSPVHQEKVACQNDPVAHQCKDQYSNAVQLAPAMSYEAMAISLQTIYIVRLTL
jgi:hypothetical protein